MNKYVITFEKKGYIQYISHLDMIRLFKRVLRRAGVRVAYSQGFHPHPKMSFALPLSLGYAGLAELLEIETEEAYQEDDFVTRVNRVLPEGVRILALREFSGNKTVASMVYAGEYRIEIPLPQQMCREGENAGDVCFESGDAAARFLAQPRILAEKLQKKTGKVQEIDLKPLIDVLEAEEVDDKIILKTTIAQGSQRTLSPELLCDAFCRFASLAPERSEIDITRVRILYHGEDGAEARRK